MCFFIADELGFHLFTGIKNFFGFSDFNDALLNEGCFLLRFHGLLLIFKPGSWRAPCAPFYSSEYDSLFRDYKC